MSEWGPWTNRRPATPIQGDLLTGNKVSNWTLKSILLSKCDRSDIQRTFWGHRDASPWKIRSYKWNGLHPLSDKHVMESQCSQKYKLITLNSLLNRSKDTKPNIARSSRSTEACRRRFIENMKIAPANCRWNDNQTKSFGLNHWSQHSHQTALKSNWPVNVKNVIDLTEWRGER